ncbi:protein ELF4-LIKE 3-like [Curcuma longa]|uniref:protein ELF4-LIKE 3-like n=1 Tax=Curcuma longa TaxID=136217 RepID=UPI003D9E0F4E
MEGDRVPGLGNGRRSENDQVAQTFKKSFVQVQSILEQNRLLINEISQNHESRSPCKLGRNVGLIRELNDNIRRVVDLYADLSVSFAKSTTEASSSGGDCSGGRPEHKRSRPP